MEATKKCSKCLVEKALEEFYLKRNQPDSQCKECKRSQRKSTYVGKSTIEAYSLTKNLFDVFFEAEKRCLDQSSIYLHKLLITKERKGSAL